MRKLTAFLIDHRKAVLALFIVMLVASLGLFLLVNVNYDLSAYLPEDSMTKHAIAEMRESFGYDGTAQAMVEDVTIPQALVIKEQLASIQGVKSVLWLDDLADLYQPLEAMDEKTVASYYKDGAALFQITFSNFDYATETGEALSAIRALEIPGLQLAGNAVDSHNMRELLAHEIITIVMVVVPFCLIILLLASSSWIEPPVYLVILAVAIGINMGTNAVFPSISFITHAMAAILQLAISLDYSLFLFHRYLEEREVGLDAREAVIAASAKSFSPILASAMTTIAGFVALVLMQYTIGRDIGLVLAKGILMSLATVMLLMPVMIYMLRNVIDKTKHKRFMPRFEKLGGLTIKLRWVLLALVVVLIVPSYLAQSKNYYLYGDNSGSSQSGQVAMTRRAIEERFGVHNPVALLVPTGSIATEASLCAELEKLPGVREVQALVTLADPAMPREALPEAVVRNFESERYSRLVVMLAQSGESEAVTETVESVTALAEAHYPGEWLAAGSPTSLNDIRKSVESDGLFVQLLSVFAVWLIVALAFRSVSVPLLLVALIQSAIWINMAVPYFSGSPLVYIGYLVVSGLQLGATIDYAILLSNRYMAERGAGVPPRDAAIAALSASGGSILISTAVLAGAGFAEAILSKLPAISEIGLLLGRGALLSGFMVLIVLPPLLMMTDKLLRAGTLRRKGAKTK